MIRCTTKGCTKTVSRQKTAGTPLEQGWFWRWTTGWRCPTHVETAETLEGSQATDGTGSS